MGSSGSGSGSGISDISGISVGVRASEDMRRGALIRALGTVKAEAPERAETRMAVENFMFVCLSCMLVAGRFF